MTTVVDLGCHDQGGKWNSLHALNHLFGPDVIYGFDPSPDLDVSVTSVDGTPAVLERKAAWVEDGVAAYNPDTVVGRWGPWSTRDEEVRVGVLGSGPERAETFDFSDWLADHGPAAVKMDIEGAEYALLSHMIAEGTHTLMTYLFIEWHEIVEEQLVCRLECPVVRWWM